MISLNDCEILSIVTDGADSKKVHFRLTPQKVIFCKQLEKEHIQKFIFNENEIMTDISNGRVYLLSIGKQET